MGKMVKTEVKWQSICNKIGWLIRRFLTPLPEPELTDSMGRHCPVVVKLISTLLLDLRDSTRKIKNLVYLIQYIF